MENDEMIFSKMKRNPKSFHSIAISVQKSKQPQWNLFKNTVFNII